MITVMRAQFERQREQVLAHLSYSNVGKSYTKKDWLDDLNDWSASDESFAEAIKPLIQIMLIEAGQQAIQEVGRQPSTFDPFTPALRQYFTDRSLKIATDVNDETEKQLRAALSQGVTAGESTYQLRARVEDIFGSASTMRADRIARTETTRAQGYADIQAWTQSGVVEGKEWFTAEDERTCRYCASLDHQTWGLSDVIFSKGDSLTIDGQTQHYNYDDVQAPPLHANCRCTLLPVLA
jgi:SPP1 gp7 family putative phage head morphogenesis protein